MSERSADLIVPGPEGGWLARALEQAGLTVRRRELDEASTGNAAVIVVSLSSEAGLSPQASFERQLAQARQGARPNTPLVALLPVDATLDDALRGLAQGVYARPVPVARLVHRIQGLLEVAAGLPPRASWAPSSPPPASPPPASPPPASPPPASPPPASPPPASPPPASPPPASPPPASASGSRGAPVSFSGPPSEHPVARERTVRLDSARPAAGASAGSVDAVAALQGSSRRSSRPPINPADATQEPSSQVSGLVENTQPVAELSPWLHRMLSDCDRRMFPAAPPLDLRFPAGDEGPLELVPRALLDVLGVPVDPAPGEGIEEHTFVAGSPKRHSEWPRLESSVGGTGSAPGPSSARDEAAQGSAPGQAPDGAPRPATQELALPAAPRVSGPPNDGHAESVVARRPDDDTGRGGLPVTRRSSPPTAGARPASARPPSARPPASGRPPSARPSSAPPQAPISSPPMSSAASLYETAVEVGGFPPPPGVSSLPELPSLLLGTPTSDGRGRWGTLSPESFLPFAEALRPLPGERRVSLRTDGEGALVHVRGGLVMALRADAPDAAERARADGPFSALHTLRRGRQQAREQVLSALTPAASASTGEDGARPEAQGGPEIVFAVYEVDPGEELRDGWPLGTLAELMLEALARCVTADWLRERWRDDLPREVRVVSAAAQRVTEAGVDPLWLDWLRQRQRLPLGALLEAVPASEALPAALVALASLDALAFVDPAEGARPHASGLGLRGEARRLIEGAYSATRDADYFTLLGVGPSAPARAVERAAAALSAALTQLDLANLDLLELEPLRRDVLECYAEAARALRDDHMRARYASALGLFVGI